MRGDVHVRCGGRVRETDWRQRQHRARARPLQVRILQRQLGGQRFRFDSADRALLAALLGALPRGALRRLQLVMSPDTVLR